MIAVVQRVASASVRIDDAVVGTIDRGLCVLLGVERGDTDDDARRMATKLVHLRIFADDEGKMNRSVIDVAGGILLISQFTLVADTSRGNRPSFIGAAPPDEAKQLYERVQEAIVALNVPVATGRFQHHMLVEIANDGPVTIILRP